MTTTFSVESSIAIGLHLIANSISDGTEKSMIAPWRKEFETYNARRQRRNAVLEAVAEGYDTIDEIAAHTQIPHASVRRIAREFVLKKKIAEVKTKNSNNRIELRFEII